MAETGRRTRFVEPHAADPNVAAQLAQRARRDRTDLVGIVDNDEAGRAWGRRLAMLLGEQGHHLTVIEPPHPGADLNSWQRLDPSWTATFARRDPRHRPAGGPSRSPARDVGFDLF